MLKIYTTPTCHTCHMLKEELREKGIGFTELNADDHMDKIVSHDFMSLPVIEEDGTFYTLEAWREK